MRWLIIAVGALYVLRLSGKLTDLESRLDAIQGVDAEIKRAMERA